MYYLNKIKLMSHSSVAVRSSKLNILVIHAMLEQLLMTVGLCCLNLELITRIK